MNERLEVIDIAGHAVPNLFALSAVIGAGAPSRKSYFNGMIVTLAITYGRVLGSS